MNTKYNNKNIPPYLAYAHDSHRTFNEQFENIPKQMNICSSWISYDAVPQVLRAFNMNHDFYIQAQMPDMKKTESQQRGEQGKSGSGMVKKDKPKALLQPPSKIRDFVDKKDFQSRWLIEQRESVLEQAKINQSRNKRSNEHHSIIKEPSQ